MLRRKRPSRAPGAATVVLVVAIVVGVGGCTTSVPQEGGPPMTSEARPTTMTPSAAASAAPIVEVKLSWQNLGRRPGLSAVTTVSPRYVAWQSTDLLGITIERRNDHVVMLRHRADKAQYEPTLVDIFADYAVIVEEDTHGEDGKRPARAFIYNLLTGHRTSVSSIKSAPALSVFGAQAAVTDDGQFYYSASRHDGKSDCVGHIDLRTLKADTVECARPGSGGTAGYYISEAEEGVAWLNHAAGDFGSCRTGRVIRHGKVSDLRPRGTCATLGTTAVADWDVSSGPNAPGPNPPPDVPIRATDGNQLVDLGRADGVTPTACGDYAYWRVTDTSTASIQIRRWRPGAATVETIYRMDNPDAAPGYRQVVLNPCAERIFSITVIGGPPSTGDQIQLLAIDSTK